MSLKVIIKSMAAVPIFLSAAATEIQPPFAPEKTGLSIPEIHSQETIHNQQNRGIPVKNYNIICGDNKLMFKSKLPLIQNLFVGKQPLPTAQILYWGASQFGFGNPFKGEKAVFAHDKASNTLILTKKFYAASNKKLDGTFIQKIRILKDGMIDFNYSYQVPTQAKINNRCLFFNFRPYKMVAGMKLLIDGKPYKFSEDDSPYGSRVVFNSKATKLEFAPDEPFKSFSIVFPKPTPVCIREFRKEKDKQDMYKYYASIQISPAVNGNLNFKLDIRKTGIKKKQGKAFAGIDFWKNDRIRVPDYGSCKNLLPNPSFESGLRYYDNFSTWGKWPGKDYPVYSIDGENAKFGNYCLKITAFKGYKRPSFLSTFAIPVIPNKKYTFSFYAKAEGPNQYLDFTCISADWGKFPKTCTLKLSEKWQRYQLTLITPNSALVGMFRVRNPEDKEQVFTYLDGIQLEQADQATVYTDNGFGSRLLTSDPNNFLSPGQKADAELQISAMPDAKIRLNYVLKDFFYHDLAKGQVDFKTDRKGEATVKLPEKVDPNLGISVLYADYKMADGKSFKDFYRISKVEPLKWDFKYCHLFGINITRLSPCNSEAWIKRIRDMGFGSTTFLTDKSVNDLFLKYNIINIGGNTILGDVDVFKNPRREELRNRIKNEGYSDKLALDIEDFSCKLVKKNPWIIVWAMLSESSAGANKKVKALRDNDINGFVKFILAAYRGIKKAAPDKTVTFTGGPANMYPNGGIHKIDTWLEAANKIDPNIKFDGVCIHPYRPSPENPDLDHDASIFFKVLKKHGYDNVPVYWNEGIYNIPWQVPEWGLDPHRGCSTDHYRCGAVTYDMGWGERIAAAYYARSWLVALKYGDRVKQYNGWSKNTVTMDTRLTPLAIQLVPNILGHLLGSSSFKRDIRFAKNCRIYIFEDEKLRPVAALWSHSTMVDRGFEPSPHTVIDWKPGPLPEFIDFMGNKVKVTIDNKGRTVIPVSPFPLFIRGKAGSLNRFCKVLQNISLGKHKKSALSVDMRLVSLENAEISVTNKLSRLFAGKIIVKSGGRTQSKALKLTSMEKNKLEVRLPKKITDKRLTHISLPITITTGSKVESKHIISLWAMGAHYAGDINIDGKLDDWSNIPEIKLTNRIIATTTGGSSSKPLTNISAGYAGDFEAEYKLAWNEKNLYVCVKVTDDKPYFPEMKSVNSDWEKDSIQIYIDTFGDNAKRKVNTLFDFNDYSYDISMRSDNGKVNVFRRTAPEQQLAGGLEAPKPNMVEPGVKARIKIIPGGYIYEAAFPWSLVAPLKLRTGTFFRFGLAVNDNDGAGHKSMLSNLPGLNKSPYEHPEEWPGILLIH